MDSMDFVPTLVGSKNWGSWNRSMKIYVLAMSERYWDLITGEWARPAPLSDEAATALIPTYEEEIHQEARLLDMPPLRRNTGSTTRETANLVRDIAEAREFGITAKFIQNIRRRDQEDWDHISNQCVLWISMKLARNMEQYLNHEETAAQLYAKLKEIGETTSLQEKVVALRAWSNWTYRGYKPFEFAMDWRRKRQEYEDMVPPERHAPPGFCCLMFLGAVSSVPGTALWLNSYCKLDPEKTDSENLEDLIVSFIHSENGRLMILEYQAKYHS